MIWMKNYKTSKKKSYRIKLISQKNTQIFTDTVSVGMEKTQNNVRIGVEQLTAHIPLLISEAQKRQSNTPSDITSGDRKNNTK